ncbi:hypothetical protein PV326_002117, partial [Microctonus aethiopoides]
MAVSGFLKGLRPQYVRLLKKMKFEKLTFAIKEAIEAETLCNEFPNLAMENNAASCFNVQHERKQNDSKYGNNRNARDVNQHNNRNQNNRNNRGSNNQYTDNNRSNNSNYQNNRSNANKNHRQNSQNNSSN